MTSTSTSTLVLLFISCLMTIVSMTTAQGRAPHGLAYETPMAFSPQAFDFFHPKTQSDPCTTSTSACSPLPMAAQVQSTKAEESKFSTTPHADTNARISAGGIAGIVIASTFVVALAMGAYFVVNKRRANLNRAQPNESA